jgi:hypothetical protein
MKNFFLVLFSLLVAGVLSTNITAQELNNKKIVMKRYLVERQFPDGLSIPVNEEGSKICLNVVSKNLRENVTWVHSYVSADKKKTFCIYDAPSPGAIKKSAKMNGFPIENITEVSVLDPYFYH